MRIMVSGAIASKPLNGGEVWVRMSWVRGLRRLGCEVCFVEQIESSRCVDESGGRTPFERSLEMREVRSSCSVIASWSCMSTWMVTRRK